MGWNFGTFAVCTRCLLSFRLLGFGLILFSTDGMGQIAEKFERELWPVSVFPGWRFAFVAPWL